MSFLLATPVSVFAANPCECVRWLREARHIPIKGDAWTQIPDLPVMYATEGDVLLTTEGPGHAAEIIGFDGSVDKGDHTEPEFIILLEANYSKCRVGVRKLRFDSPVIRGIKHYPQPSTTNSYDVQ